MYNPRLNRILLFVTFLSSIGLLLLITLKDGKEEIEYLRLSPARNFDSVQQLLKISVAQKKSYFPYSSKKLLLAQNIPVELKRMTIEDKESLYISLVLPHILIANEMVSNDRLRIIELQEKTAKYQRLTFRERSWLQKLSTTYGLKTIDFAELLKRVDNIPASLVLAQSILESGWGTSRFAVSGNSLFGIRYQGRTGTTRITNINKTVTLSSYPTIGDSVIAYFELLNSSYSYSHFRDVRASFKASDSKPHNTVEDLCDTLTNYSELGSEYSHRLKLIINRYQLTDYDTLDFPIGSELVKVHFNRES
ncbi:MAG: hypothetical protein D6B25_14875 [Desulfobulbaceae bacterium]|nr:MAG: hypothetical protein D6B25_14875 [Desulfobulbaceae bacterium]